MIERIIESAIKQRFLVMLASALLVAFGVYSTLKINIESFPDVSNIQVQVNTEAPGLAASEVEQLITFPVESVMNGLPDITDVRSISKAGLSVVTIVFKDQVDIYFARQLVFERLQSAKERIPNGLGEPEIGPITTGMGQIFKYVLAGEGKNTMELRAINDWMVKNQLRTVPGVTDVISFGGEVRQYQVRVDPNKLAMYKLSLPEVRDALATNNSNAGGWYLEGEHEQMVIRGEGMIRGGPEGLKDLENIVLKSVDGSPVYVRDVAEVGFGGEIRQGAVSLNGKGEAVMGIILQLKGANTKKVITAVREKVKTIQASLPAGVKINPIYDQADLVEKSVSMVSKALMESAVLIFLVLFFFLWNVRSSLVVILSIPVSLLIAFIMMRWFNLSANLQSLGGLAIGIGMMVDGSVVMVDNVLRHLSEPNRENETLSQRILFAAQDVGRPVFFAVLIIGVVFLPLFTLQGIEGKLFTPMAFAIVFAMLGSLIVALTIVPALASYVFHNGQKETENRLFHWMKIKYQYILGWVLKHRLIVIGSAVVALTASLATVPFLGTEFVPELDEGSMAIRVTMPPSISLKESLLIASRLEKKLVKYPEVISAFSQIGRAEIGGDPEAISNNEIFVQLKPQSQWRTAKSRAGLIEVFEKDLGEYPGILLNFSQPIATRVDELLSGVKAQIAVKLFGEDLGVLEEKGQEIEKIINSIRGASDVQLEQVSGETQLVVRADRDAMARYGLNTSKVMEVVSLAVGGEAVTQIIEGQKRFDAYLRIAEPFRNREEIIGNLWIVTETGARVPLSQVAQIRRVDGPPAINRENTQRRVVILCNVRGRDMGSFVDEAKTKIRKHLKFPAGYYITWGGQFENQQRAQATLMIVVPVCLGLIFLLLYLSFNSFKNATLIIMNVPFALIGGIFALAVSGQYLSVPSSVGFIALFGVAVLNGVVMVSNINQLVREGMKVDKAVMTGSLLRLRPVLMTAIITGFGLIPLLLSTGVGSEVQRPLASVVVGGLVSSTILTLLILPALYKWFAINPDEEETLGRTT